MSLEGDPVSLSVPSAPSADPASAPALAAAPPAVNAAAPAEKLDDIEDIDFLLEEIENKIAPLALARPDRR